MRLRMRFMSAAVNLEQFSKKTRDLLMLVHNYTPGTKYIGGI